jgi:hypothetical protein
MTFTNIPFKRIFSNDIPRACLPLTITNPKNDKIHNVYGIIDTGADECAFPAYIAGMIGINLKKGRSKVIATGNGHTKAYSHNVTLAIEDFRINNVLVDFLPNLHIPLLGVKSFLSKFVLTIDYPGQKFSLKRK